MKTAIITVILFITSVFCYQTQAQISIVTRSETSDEVQALMAKKEEVRKEEKEALKEDIKAINEKLEQGKITNTEAEKLKKDTAKNHAMNIEDRLNIIDSKVALLERNPKKTTQLSIGFGLSGDDREPVATDTIPHRTISGGFIAFGLNNALIEGRSLNDSPYKIGGSRFFEIGYGFTTSLFKNGFVRLKYGISFQFNGLKIKDNLYFVDKDDQVYLEKYPVSLDKSKFRNDNLVIPLHIEFGPATVVQDSAKAHYSTNSHFKIGLGGFLGLNLNSVQKLKYDMDGDNEKRKLKGYNTTNFIYGVSAYVGYDWYSLYIKYNLNPLFADNNVEQQMVSVGILLGY